MGTYRLSVSSRRPHRRRNRFGRVIIPKNAYASFKHARAEGMLDAQHTWRTFNRAWRHRRAVRRIARASRKRNRVR
jgi:hypothetical protein